LKSLGVSILALSAYIKYIIYFFFSNRFRLLGEVVSATGKCIRPKVWTKTEKLLKKDISFPRSRKKIVDTTEP